MVNLTEKVKDALTNTKEFVSGEEIGELCMACGKDFDSDVELQKHMETEHGAWIYSSVDYPSANHYYLPIASERGGERGESHIHLLFHYRLVILVIDQIESHGNRNWNDYWIDWCFRNSAKSYTGS